MKYLELTLFIKQLSFADVSDKQRGPLVKWHPMMTKPSENRDYLLKGINIYKDMPQFSNKWLGGKFST
jgi:hypothetical protein